jgi:hypothetical protein
MKDLTASEAGMSRWGFYTSRLKAIPQDVLTEVLTQVLTEILTEKRMGNFGLIITVAANQAMPSQNTSVFLCQP